MAGLGGRVDPEVEAMSVDQTSKPPRRRTVRLAAAALSGILAIVYVVLLVIVFQRERGQGAYGESTYGAYLLLTIPYAIGTVLLLVPRLDRQVFWLVGAVLQAGVIVLYVWFGREADLSMAWGTVTVVLQAGLLGLLLYLGLKPPPPTRNEKLVTGVSRRR